MAGENDTMQEKTEQNALQFGEQNEGFLAAVRMAVKLYDRFLEPVRDEYGLSKLELVVIGFLHNNPGKDTVGEIASLRSLSKGNVSCAVDSLSAKGLLSREPDKKDRRSVHLHLQKTAMPIVAKIEAIGEDYKNQVLYGFSEEERELYVRLYDKMLQNMKDSLREKNEK